MIDNDIISGERIQQLCDVYCGNEYHLYRNPIIANQKNKHLNIENLNEKWDNPRLIFCYSSSLKTFMNKLNLLTNKFVLVSHNEDDNVTDEYNAILMSPLLIKWFAQNVMTYNTKLELLPIGVANSMWLHGNINNIITVKNLNLQKIDKIYYYFNITTNYTERNKCKNIIDNKGLQFGNFESHLSYLQNLSTSKFAISPPGNGIDCHRIWECYYFNVIPIVLRSVFTEQLSNILPCIILDKWEDFDEHKILSEYDILSNKLKNNTKYLSFEYYLNEIKSIKEINLINKYFSYCDSKGIHFDFKLDEIFNKKENGFFVELGGYDGLTQSNTAFFEFTRNWKGIIIEPSLNLHKECIKNRPNSICVNSACVSNEYDLPTIKGDFNRDVCMSSVNGKRLNSSVESLVEIPALTLEKIFDTHNVSNIDFLSLDVEGYELNVLKGINLNKYRPKYLLIEIYSFDYDNIISFLQQNNYICVCNFSSFNKIDNPGWDGTHQDFLFIDIL